MKIIMLLVMVFSFGTAQVYPGSKSEHFKLVTDVLDELGGASQSSNFKIRVSSSGQPSAIGEQGSTKFKARGGYMHSASVLHGDANADGSIDAGDLVYLQNYLYVGGPAPIPLEAGDVNCDRIVDGGDVVYLLNYLYIKGPPPCDPPDPSCLGVTKNLK
jgi:hypothetical protein